MQTQTQNITDYELRHTVATQIDWEPEVASRDISVSAWDGIVSLTGFVHNYTEKVAAERAAKSVYGVRAVANDIEVRPAGLRTDPEIARDIVHAMTADIAVPRDGITATVRDGYVTLEGKVDWNFQRTAAVACANRIGGVRGVTSQIAVKASPAPGDIKIRIDDALRRSAEVDSRRISVLARDGTVELSGNVRSWFEREEAERAAWSAAGVYDVINHVHVVP